MPLPEPELAGEGEGVFARGAEELACGERHGRGVEDAARDVDEWDDENEFERIYDVIANLRGGYVETKDKREGEAEDGGAAEDGVDADEETDGDAPCQFFRGCSHAKEREDRKGDAAIDPAVMNGSGAALGGTGAI